MYWLEHDQNTGNEQPGHGSLNEHHSRRSRFELTKHIGPSNDTDGAGHERQSTTEIDRASARRHSGVEISQPPKHAQNQPAVPACESCDSEGPRCSGTAELRFESRECDARDHIDHKTQKLRVSKWNKPL